MKYRIYWIIYPQILILTNFYKSFLEIAINLDIQYPYNLFRPTWNSNFGF
jgi:hypothetical protein